MYPDNKARNCETNETQICHVLEGECVCIPLHTKHKLNPLLVGFQGVVLVIGIAASIIVSTYFFGFTNAYLYISIWLFCASVAALFYLENYITNSFIVSSIIPMAMLVLTNLDVFIFDYGHFFVMAVAILVLILNKPVSVVLVIAFSGIGIGWYAAVKWIIYPTMPTILTFAFATAINALIIILISRRRTRLPKVK